MPKKTFLIGILLILFCGKIFAVDTAPPLTNSAPKRWFSKDSQDTIIFGNDAGEELYMDITIDDDETNPGVTGVIVYNCDDDNPKQHYDAGSMFTCRTHDPNNPVKIESDRAGQRASGTITIRTR